MSDKPDSRRAQRRIGAAAKAQFLAALRRGERREDAAAAAGFSLMGFYGARHRDPVFAAGWTEALATSAAAERRDRAYATRGAERGEIRIACANRRIYQRRRRRNVRFDAAAQAVFLAHLAATCDTKASAEAAGVSESTIHYHRRTDPAFAEAYEEALRYGYLLLEAEALRQRLAAPARLRAALDAARPVEPRALAACPQCGRTREDEAAAEFDRILKLLALRSRKPRRVERGFKPGGRRQDWTFDMAIKALGRKMEALGIPLPPPPGAAGKK